MRSSTKRQLTKRLLSILFPLALLLAPALAFAQSPNAAPAKGGGAGDEGWETVHGEMVQPGETVKATHLVGAAYGFIWLMVAGFVFTVWRRTGAVERELSQLQSLVRDHIGASQAKGE